LPIVGQSLLMVHWVLFYLVKTFFY